MLRIFHLMICTFVILIVGSGIFAYVKSSHDTIYVGVDGYSAPFSLTTKSGDLSGYGIDIIRAVAKAVNVDVEFRIIPFDALHDSLRKGTVDVVIAPFDPDLEENRKNSLFTDPYYINHYIYITRDYSLDHDLARKSVSGLKICTTDKPDLLKFLRVHFSTDNIMIYDSLSKAFSGLYQNDCDMVVDSKSSATYYIKKHSLRKLRVHDLKRNSQKVYRIALGSDKRELRDLLNSGLDYVVQTREIDRIDRKWFGTDSELSSVSVRHNKK
ncbi:MAG: substrate-binding periplasmic protein [Succinivibrio sp.]